MGRTLSILLLPCLLAGCLTVKTEHKIEPIHITVDVNLKIQKELDNFFADLDAASQTRDYTPPPSAPSSINNP